MFVGSAYVDLVADGIDPTLDDEEVSSGLSSDEDGEPATLVSLQPAFNRALTD